jgi:hypothetical protein
MKHHKRKKLLKLRRKQKAVRQRYIPWSLLWAVPLCLMLTGCQGLLHSDTEPQPKPKPTLPPIERVTKPAPTGVA